MVSIILISYCSKCITHYTMGIVFESKYIKNVRKRDSQPRNHICSVYLLLPWIIVNTCLILFSSILVLSLSISHPTKKDVLFCLILSILAVFPIATAIVMSLPAYVFIRRIPKYKKQLHNSELFRQVTKRKTAAEIEAEIKQRRREQVKNTIITDKSYEQFIYVSRAANKWMKKIEKKRSQAQDSPPETMIPEAEMFAEGNVTVNVGYNGLDTVAEETHDTVHSESSEWR